MGRKKLHLAVNALEVDPPTDGERTHRQQADASARLVPHGGRRLVEHRDDVDGIVPQGAEPVLQGQGLVVDAQPQPAGRDVFLDLIAILGREAAGSVEAGLVIRRGVDVHEQRESSGRVSAVTAEQRDQRTARVRRVDERQTQGPHVIEVDLRELSNAAPKRLHPVVAAAGVAKVLENGEAVVVARDRQRLIPASAPGKAGEIDDAEIMLRLLQLVEHGIAIHPVELQAAGKPRNAFVPPQVQWVRGKQNGLPGGPSALQRRPDLNDVERRDGLEEELGPGVIDLVHRRMVLREPGVEPITGLQEFRRCGTEPGLAGEGQHGLMKQDVEMAQDDLPGRDHAIPTVAKVLVRHAAVGQLPLHCVEQRPQVVPPTVMRNRPLQRLEARRIALAVVPKRVLEGRARRFDHPAPGFGRAEEANPGQNLPLDLELEPLFVAVRLVLTARGVFLPIDGLGQGPPNLTDERLELRVLAVDQQFASVPGYRAIVSDTRPLRLVLVVGWGDCAR